MKGNLPRKARGQERKEGRQTEGRKDRRERGEEKKKRKKLTNGPEPEK